VQEKKLERMLREFRSLSSCGVGEDRKKEGASLSERKLIKTQTQDVRERMHPAHADCLQCQIEVLWRKCALGETNSDATPPLR